MCTTCTNDLSTDAVEFTTYMHAFSPISIYIYIYSLEYSHTRVCPYTFVYTYSTIHIYIHIHMYVYASVRIAHISLCFMYMYTHGFMYMYGLALHNIFAIVKCKTPHGKRARAEPALSLDIPCTVYTVPRVISFSHSLVSR